MAGSDFELVFDALARARVRYLVVGGVAVVLHGHPRFTADVDLLVDLDSANVRAMVGALAGLGYRPRAPVDALDFADPDTRRAWIADKGLAVFSFWSPEHPVTEIDVFVTEPFPVEAALERAVLVRIGEVTVPVASIADLIELKRRAARPKDLQDIRALEAMLAAEDERG